MLSDRCLPVLFVCLFVSLSVTLLYCGQMVGWIKMKLGMRLDLGPGHVVLDVDQLPSPKGADHPILGPYLLWPNGCMDQNATWYGGKPRPRRPCIRWGPRSPPQKGGRSPQIFGPCLLWPNGWMDQDGTWHGGRTQPRRLCVRRGTQPLSRRSPPMFGGPCLLRPNGCMDQDATSYGGRPRLRRHCVTWGPSSHFP